MRLGEILTASPQAGQVPITHPLFVRLLRGCHRREIVSASSGRIARIFYRIGWREFQEACRRTCMARNALYVPARTDVAFEHLVLRTLRQAGVLEAV